MKFWRHKRERDTEMILLHCTYSWLGCSENYIIDFFFVYKYKTVTSFTSFCNMMQYNKKTSVYYTTIQDDLSVWDLYNQGVKQQDVTVNLKK